MKLFFCCLVTSRFFEHSRPSANLFFGTNQQFFIWGFSVGSRTDIVSICVNCRFGGSVFFISTPVILSHFQYLQVEHDSLDIDAEVQWHPWHSSKKWCMVCAPLSGFKGDWNHYKYQGGLKLTHQMEPNFLGFLLLLNPPKPPSSCSKFTCWTLTLHMSGQVGLEQSSGIDAHPGEVWNLDSKFFVFGDFLEVKLGFACRYMITNRNIKMF